jgi:hypothetical protein
MYPEIIILFLVLIFGTVSCTPLISKPPALEPTTTPEIFSPQPANLRAFEAARIYIAEELDAEPMKLTLVDVTPLDWPDACLGLPKPDEVCAQIVTPGFRLNVRGGNAIYEFQTNRDASQVRQKTITREFPA